jgi:hypothetical protein
MAGTALFKFNKRALSADIHLLCPAAAERWRKRDAQKESREKAPGVITEVIKRLGDFLLVLLPRCRSTFLLLLRGRWSVRCGIKIKVETQQQKQIISALAHTHK